MDKVINIFEEADPLDVVYRAMLEKNPELAKYGKAGFTILKIMPATGSRNTEARLVGNGNLGIEGILSVFYDRADLGKLSNQSTGRKPTLNVSLPAGTILTYATLLQQINDLLGYNLQLTGKWPDIQAGSVTVPARNAKIQFVLQSVPSANGGFSPAAMRTLPGTSLQIDMVNRGQTIASAVTSRSINPFVKVDGNINWTGETISADHTKAKKSLLLKIINVDFSDIVNEVTERSNIYWGGLQAGNALAWFVRQGLVDGVKRRCAELDIPVIDFGKPCRQSGWDVTFDAQLPGHAPKFWNSMFRPVADLGNAPWANPKFTKCILTTASFQNGYGFPTSGTYAPIAAKVEAKEGWATDLANYPINYNLP